MIVATVRQIRDAQERQQRVEAQKERDMLRERLKYAEKRVKRLEGALSRVMQGSH